MKLITRTMLLYLLISLPLLILAGWYSYETINEEVKDATDESLYRQKLELIELVKSLEKPHDFYLRSDSLTAIKVLPGKTSVNRFYDTVIYDKPEDEFLKYRVYRSYYIYHGSHYLLSCAKPLLEEDELVEGLLSGFLLLTGFLLLSLLIVNFGISRSLWKPFYRTISKLDAYKLDEQQTLRFDKTSVSEFKKLNSSLERMTQKIAEDYLRQKEFTENASHELQTPLAIIRTKLDLLLQSNLGAEESEILQSLDTAVNRISSLNKALLLLTKIENGQFTDHSPVRMKEVVSRSLDSYGLLFEHKKINIVSKLSDDCVVEMNATLAELLVNNLIRNAYRHNHTDGSINIRLSTSQFEISNTGTPLAVPQEQMFERFKKNEASSESLGLGLSIVKSIATIYHFEVSYRYENDHHTFTVMFSK